MRHVNTDLMGATCFQTALDQARLFERFDHMIVGNSMFAARFR